MSCQTKRRHDALEPNAKQTGAANHVYCLHTTVLVQRVNRNQAKQPRPQGFSLKKWVGREKALASAGHVHSLNIPEKLIYMQPAGFALAEVERRNNGK